MTTESDVKIQTSIKEPLREMLSAAVISTNAKRTIGGTDERSSGGRCNVMTITERTNINIRFLLKNVKTANSVARPALEKPYIYWHRTGRGVALLADL